MKLLVPVRALRTRTDRWPGKTTSPRTWLTSAHLLRQGLERRLLRTASWVESAPRQWGPRARFGRTPACSAARRLGATGPQNQTERILLRIWLSGLEPAPALRMTHPATPASGFWSAPSTLRTGPQVHLPLGKRPSVLRTWRLGRCLN